MITENTYGKWCIAPTINANESMTETEKKARKQLLTYGIDSRMLEEHAQKRIQSDIIATYRIVVHKILSSNYLPSVTRKAMRKVNHARSHLCLIL